MKILLVDDSNTMRRIQKTQLNKIGIENIIEAENGEQALGALKENMPIDCVLLDWNMPVMDGLSCLKAIRADDAFKDVKVIMCTSESEKAKVLETIKAGANDYIVKPFTPEALVKKLNL